MQTYKTKTIRMTGVNAEHVLIRNRHKKYKYNLVISKKYTFNICTYVQVVIKESLY